MSSCNLVRQIKMASDHWARTLGLFFRCLPTHCLHQWHKKQSLHSICSLQVDGNWFTFGPALLPLLRDVCVCRCVCLLCVQDKFQPSWMHSSNGTTHTLATFWSPCLPCAYPLLYLKLVLCTCTQRTQACVFHLLSCQLFALSFSFCYVGTSKSIKEVTSQWKK